MTDQLDSIINSLTSDVKRKNEYVESTYENINWTKIEQLEISKNNNRIISASPDAPANNAYTDIEKRARLNKLTDSFRMSEDKTFESNTTRSLAETISRYARQHSIIQAHC